MHPLEPLTPEEIEKVRDVLVREERVRGTTRFVSVALHEPPKAAVLAFEGGAEVEREAFVVLRERRERLTYEAIVSLTRDEVVSWRAVEGVQPMVTLEELAAVDGVVRRDRRWQEALRRRGVTDLSLAVVSGWPLGNRGPEDGPERGRFLLPLTAVRSGSDDDAGAHPVEGLLVRVDLDRMRVVDVEDHGVVDLPPATGSYTPDGIRRPENVPWFPDGPRRDLRPLRIEQPDGWSFTVEGHEVRWQKWRFRIGFTAREGLVLHQVGYEDGGRVRSILYRASLSEMFVPYGDPRPTHRVKGVMDVGEYGIGLSTNRQRLGCDCLGAIRYLDAWVNDAGGRPSRIENAICMHEEDCGVLWKRHDARTGRTEVRRSRRLVVSATATIGNYEYLYAWHLYQDGTIEHRVRLTGVISTGALPAGELPAHGTLVAPGLYGPHHQHFFCVRLDMAVDGVENSVYECDSVPLPPGDENPLGNAWRVEARLLARESEARRQVSPQTARHWRVVNPGRRNRVGQPVAYQLQPGENVPLLCSPDSPFARRAGFATSHLWVTAYDPAERYAAGDYPNQHPGGTGLPAYVAADRPLEGADVVLWYTFGAHHVVRPEDWPVMPAVTAGFQLRPSGFFDGSPALDVPVPEPDGCAAT